MHLEESDSGVRKVIVDAQPHKNLQNRCSYCNNGRKLPEMINFDEVYAFRSTDSKYVFILLDFKTQTPIDALPSRRHDYLHS